MRAAAAAMTIDNHLLPALKKGLFFRGVGKLPFGEQIRSVRELLARLLTQAEAVPSLGVDAG